MPNYVRPVPIMLEILLIILMRISQNYSFVLSPAIVPKLFSEDTLALEVQASK